jgi:hypothetical protein
VGSYGSARSTKPENDVAKDVRDAFVRALPADPTTATVNFGLVAARAFLVDTSNKTAYPRRMVRTGRRP